jgi:hypothetical protein
MNQQRPKKADYVSSVLIYNNRNNCKTNNADHEYGKADSKNGKYSAFQSV